MSKNKKELKTLSLAELQTKICEFEAQLFKLKIQKATGQLANTSLMKNVRHELARAKTYTTQKSQR